MDRLTKRIILKNGQSTVDFSNEKVGEFLTDHKKGIRALFEKVAEYEDLEEQGLIVKLPCKIGQKVYAVTRDFVSEYTICSIEVYNEGFFFHWKCDKGIYINVRGFTNYQIGVDVFLTKGEAEQSFSQLN